MIHSVKLTGQSHGKGRNGYFALSHTTLMEVASDQEQPFHLDFCSKRSGAAGAARLLLTREDAEALRGFLNRHLRETGKVEKGELVCRCGEHGLPALAEDGMIVSHKLVSIDGNQLIARGWDGSSRAASEDGEVLLLECRNLLAPVRPPRRPWDRVAVSYRDFGQIRNSRIRAAMRVSSECPFLEVRIAAEPLCVGMTSGVEVDNRSDGDTQGAEVNGQSGPSLCRVQSGLGRAV